jgi:hypothetical protein
MRKRLLNKDEIMAVVGAKRACLNFIDIVTRYEAEEKRIDSLNRGGIEIIIEAEGKSEQLHGWSMYRELVNKVREGLDIMERKLK